MAYWFNKQNNSSARASRFWYISLTSTARLQHETSYTVHVMRSFMEEVTIRRRIFLLYLKLNKLLTNSPPGEIAYIRPIERVQIDPIKIEEMLVHFLTDVFNTNKSLLLFDYI